MTAWHARVKRHAFERLLYCSIFVYSIFLYFISLKQRRLSCHFRLEERQRIKSLFQKAYSYKPGVDIIYNKST